MNDDKKEPVDSETILITLDQIGQTIDVMTNVVDRLRSYITQQSTTKNPPEQFTLNDCERSSTQTLH